MFIKTILTSVFTLFLLTALSGTLYSQDDGTVPQKSESSEAIDRTYDENGYDINGFDRNGYDKEGYNKNGINKAGYDRNGNYRYETKNGSEVKSGDGNTGTTGTSSEEPANEYQAPPGSTESK